MTITTGFDQNCKRCKRLADFLRDSKNKFPDYHCAPVAPFGPKNIKLLIVGLAPGLHGANATGRPFTGDFAGILLYETLHKFGYGNKTVSESLNDGLKLKDCRITNAVKCVPPQNKPTGEEIKICNEFLHNELAELKPGTVILALGGIAHASVLRAAGLKPKDGKFGHGNIHHLPNELILIDSYHCSRYNTQTRRLTEKMFHAVFEKIESLKS
ncbi:MAG: uracil-DNA glycosylase [Gammaproteobacteria bacterium]|nr:uracil-DNA glycosylase [Gammaproteobacteria bacterium]MDH5594443.1 uracil-DNA glycosylase [Gammaproteobacteria bacterium]MDH5613701.1 uracil-DNA glycosylase [Gammaproteobacteria bacterium]